MKVWIWALIATISLSLVNCKNAKKTPLQTSKNKNDSIPRYDSLNWAAQFEFDPVNLIDKTNKYSFLDNFYQNFWMKNKASGSFLVAQNGKILYENYSGYSDISKQIPITAETPLHIASISKVLTSLAVLKLVEHKEIKLNDKVEKYLKGFPYKDVTIENLLSHRSGLPNYLSFSEDKRYWDRTKKMTNQDVLDVMINEKPAAFAKPGKKFAYNNTNFVLLALIIEKVTGMKYPQAMDYMVFKPLGMTHTFVMDFKKDSARVSKSYYYNGNEWGYDHLDMTYGDKNIYSTPRDLFNMDIAMYSDKFLPEKLKEKAWKGYSYEAPGVKNYGLGIRMMEWKNGNKILYHNGLWHGNNSVYVRDYAHQATIIAIGNRKNGTIYKTFRLVSLFGDYPFKVDFPGSTQPLNKLQKDIDSVKQKTREERVEKTKKKVDSLKKENEKLKKK